MAKKEGSSKQRAVKVGITMGDINGIGVEVIIKALSDNRLMDGITPIIYGSSRVVSAHKKILNLEFNFNRIEGAEKAIAKKVNLISCWKEEVKVEIGERTATGGKYALKSLEAAVNDLASGKIDVLVTAPIDKKAIQSDDFKFPGHTEYLAKMANVNEALMFMVSDDLRVGVVTGHIPLKDVSDSLSKEKIGDRITQMHNSLQKDFGIHKPKIAVLGLNPHAGEKGMMGDEEDKIIIPAIKNANNNGQMVYGPYPADGFFGSSNFKKFDAILAMYHDQGLIPFKALTFNRGVNYTAGLPIVRTSPDHGTAFEIAGKNMANEGSFRQAIYLSKDVFTNRQKYKEMNADPLKTEKKNN